MLSVEVMAGRKTAVPDWEKNIKIRLAKDESGKSQNRKDL